MKKKNKSEPVMKLEEAPEFVVTHSDVTNKRFLAQINHGSVDFLAGTYTVQYKIIGQIPEKEKEKK